MPTIYSTQASVVGGRSGHVETEDGFLRLDLAIPKEMGGNGGGTNPEQLFAAAYAASFESVLRALRSDEEVALKSASVTATVRLASNGHGAFSLTVRLRIELDGLEQRQAEALAAEAHRVCPYSNALRGNVDVALDVLTMAATA